MLSPSWQATLTEQVHQMGSSGLYKLERQLLGLQGAEVRTPQAPVLNFCANNYLGLANHPEITKTARATLERYGYGMASVRFICGTQGLHKRLETAISEFLGSEDTILYGSCFDANTGLFETLLDERDAIISDALNYASLIDGIRLSKAQRFRYAHGDMANLEHALKEAAGARVRLIATDGVFSMDGDLANLPAIVELAERYEAGVIVDDTHATGVLGEHGCGTPDYFGVAERVDLVTSTLGKALGGGAGRLTSGRR